MWFQGCASAFWFSSTRRCLSSALCQCLFLLLFSWVSLWFMDGLPCVGTTCCYMSTLLCVQVKIFVTGLYSHFCLIMTRNCKNLATKAYSTGVLIFRSVLISVIEVQYLLGTDSRIVLQNFQSPLPKFCDDQCPVSKARMLHQWAGILEASTSM